MTNGTRYTCIVPEDGGAKRTGLTRWIKERWFREGLKNRMALYAAFLARVAGAAVDPMAVRVQFTRSLPVNGLEEAQTLEKLGGIADRNALQARAAALLENA